MHSISNEKEPLLSCSSSLDLVLVVDLVNPSRGEPELDLLPIGVNECPNKCFLYDNVPQSDEDLFVTMARVGVPLYDIVINLFNDYIFELDYHIIKPNPNFPFHFDLTVFESLYIGINES